MAVNMPPPSPFDAPKPSTKCFLAGKHDLHIIVDDSSLMRPLWADVRQGIQDVLLSACNYDSKVNSVQVSFYNHRQVCTIKRVDQVGRLFNSVVAHGSKPTGPALRRITGPYWREFEEDLPQRPLSVVVLTNGGCDDLDTVQALLMESAKKIRRMRLPRGQLTFSFIGFGTRYKLAVHNGLKRVIEEVNNMHGQVDIAEYVVMEKSIEEPCNARIVEFLFGLESSPRSIQSSPSRISEASTSGASVGTTATRSSILEGQ